MHLKNNSFSLIELMVVIAIIGILSAIAAPSYKSYVIRAKVASGIPILTNALDTAIQQYDANGIFPTLTVYGVSLAPNPGDGAVAVLNNPPIVGIHYNQSTNLQTMWVCVYFSDLGIPDFVAWNGSDPNSGTSTRLCMMSVLENGTYQKICGYFNGAVSDITNNNPQYAPQCNTNLSLG